MLSAYVAVSVHSSFLQIPATIIARYLTNHPKGYLSHTHTLLLSSAISLSDVKSHSSSNKTQPSLPMSCLTCNLFFPGGPTTTGGRGGRQARRHTAPDTHVPPEDNGVDAGTDAGTGAGAGAGAAQEEVEPPARPVGGFPLCRLQ